MSCIMTIFYAKNDKLKDFVVTIKHLESLRQQKITYGHKEIVVYFKDIWIFFILNMFINLF